MNLRVLNEPESVTDLCAHRALYPSDAPCMHPQCSQPCHYPESTRGRRQMFCSSSCAKDYSAQRLSLIRELQYIDTALRQGGTRGNLASQLRSQRAHARWHLARFGGEPTPAITASAPTGISGDLAARVSNE